MKNKKSEYDSVIIVFALIFLFITMGVGILAYFYAENKSSNSSKQESSVKESENKPEISDKDIYKKNEHKNRHLLKLPPVADFTFAISMENRRGKHLINSHTFSFGKKVPYEEKLFIHFKITDENQKNIDISEGLAGYFLEIKNSRGITLFSASGSPTAWFEGPAESTSVSVKTSSPVDLKNKTEVIFKEFRRKNDKLLFKFTIDGKNNS
ncbi:MAG: hypothetical protein R6W70_10200 [bacterium]